jgi:predicted metal-dependent phosphotriesterase family hydrolase
MNRRHFLKSLPATLLLPRALSPQPLQIQSVQGPLPADKLGMTLMHEHVMVDFIGADKASRERYNRDEVFRAALPLLKQVRSLGCDTLVDCTPAYIGRDPVLLKELSAASGLHLLTTTGYYGAANDKFVPQHAYQEGAEQLANRWRTEFTNGIEGTGIKPGIIKTGVDKGALSDIDAKLVRAAARTHLKTGLTIASHTGDGVAAMEELALLKGEGVAASAFIWVHAQNESDTALHAKAAEQGAWVEFDGISEKSLERHLQFVKGMIDRGFIDRVLISQDSGWYHVGEPAGGNFRNYDFLFTHFIPALKKTGMSDDQVRKLLIDNPRRALTLTIRKLPGAR